MGDTKIEDNLYRPILLTEHVRKSIEESESYRLECIELGHQVDRLSQILRSTVRFVTSSDISLYEPPVLRVASECSKNLEKALTLTRKCRHRNFLRRLVTITSATDFRKVVALLDASLGDFRWLLSVFEATGGDIVLSLPPIASNDPILSWVWSFIATAQMGQLSDRVDAAQRLAGLASDNDRNKKMIVNEGGVSPLLDLLKEPNSADARIAGATALASLANSQDRTRAIVGELGVPTIVDALSTSPASVQIHLTRLVGIMAESDPTVAREEFGRENVIRPLVSLLMPNPPEVRSLLKAISAETLWKLAKGSVSNSKRIAETKGLLCLAKLIESEVGEVQMNCLIAVMEITRVAESNADLRRSAFRTNSLAAKAVVDQLLRIVKENDVSALQIPAIKSMGSLARTFPARGTHIIAPLVTQLSHGSLEVATEAAISLAKFVCPDNFLRAEHSKTMIEFNSIQPCLRLLRSGERCQLHGLVLLCYLALHAGNNEALEKARVKNALEGADRSVAVQNPDLKELVSKAVHHLNLYHHTALVPQRLSYTG